MTHYKLVILDEKTETHYFDEVDKALVYAAHEAVDRGLVFALSGPYKDVAGSVTAPAQLALWGEP